MQTAQARHGGNYSPAERLADAVVHWAGLGLALAAIPVLVTVSALLLGEPPVIAAVSIYAAALLAMIAVSAAYHLNPGSPWREALRRCDHATIYLKIAATQTPFAAMIGGERIGWALAAIWFAALAGAAGKLLAPHAMRRVALPLYLVLGWAGLTLMWPGENSRPLGAPTTLLIVIGGALYSVGVVFFLWERLRFHNAIWHGFVLVASFVFYSAVLTEIGMRAAAQP